MRLKILVQFLVGALIVSTLSGCFTANGSIVFDCKGLFVPAALALLGDYQNDPGGELITFTLTDGTGAVSGPIPFGSTIPMAPSSTINPSDINLPFGPGAPFPITISIDNPAGNSLPARHIATISTGNCNGPKPLFTDGRINPEAQATVVGYCTKDHGVIAYLPPFATPIFTATADEIKKALALATNPKNPHHVLIKQNFGQQLWALKSNELQFHDAMGVKYDFIFPATRCAQ